MNEKVVTQVHANQYDLFEGKKGNKSERKDNL